MDGDSRRDDGKTLVDGDNFFWQDYLEAKNTVEVPQISFQHVEDTLQNGIEIGMSLEVPVKKTKNNKNRNNGNSSSSGDDDVIDEETNDCYWVASIVMACGPLLRLNYYGATDKSLEFWFNLTKETAHELGWCVKNKKKLEAPSNVLEKSPNCVDKLQEFLKSAKSIPYEMLSGDGLSLFDRIKPEMKVEVSDAHHPYKAWVATIKDNVGGRLLLQYDTPGSATDQFWMFCTSERLHQYRFVSKANSNWFLEPPSSIIDMHSYEEWKDLTDYGSKDLDVPDNLFNNSIDHPKHAFKLNMKLEVVSPSDRTKICPATVVKVFDDTYFLVQVDVYKKNIDEKSNDDDEDDDEDDDDDVYDLTEKNTWLCTAEHPYIFPAGWAEKHDISLSSPPNWTPRSRKFDWGEYLKATDAVAADKSLFVPQESALDAGFETYMMLEAVDPQDENSICATHITKIVDNLLWLKLDNYAEDCPEYIVNMRSLQIFPVGWCETNHYPLNPPKDYAELCTKTEVMPTKKIVAIDFPLTEHRSSLWCPKIYFNYRCFTGPMISKGKLATLPKSVGPGPVILVMREVLSMIVSVGYRSARILKVLQCENTKPEPGYHLEALKAKHKSNVYRANVAIITSGDMVSEFCRNICKKLHVCPNLFGPLCVQEDECPDNCFKAPKNKNTPAAGCVKGKSSKPGASLLVQKQKPWGKRKRRRGRWANREKEHNEEFEQEHEMPFLSMDLTNRVTNGQQDTYDSKNNLSDGETMDKSIEKSERVDEIKQEIPSSNVSEDSRSSFNDRKSKDSNDSPSSSSGDKGHSIKDNKNEKLTRARKRERGWDSSVETDVSEVEDDKDYLQMKTRRPKTRKLESNPLFWSVDDVFRYLRKTNDCKELAHRVRQEEIDGLAFLLLNMPSLIEHMKIKMSSAMKLCRHVEQVKVTYFLKHINEDEPDDYRVM